MRKYDDKELKVVLEGLRSKAVRAEVEELFASMRATRVHALERRRHLFEMIKNCSRAEDSVNDGRFDELNQGLKEVRLKEIRLQARFAGEMLPLVEMEMRILDSDFEERDEDMLEEERMYEGEDDVDEGLRMNDRMIRDLRDLN